MRNRSRTQSPRYPGQDNAKRSVAIALRNRWRRMQLERKPAC